MILDRRTLLAGLTATPLVADAADRQGSRLHADSFRHGLKQWVVEAEKPATVTAKNGVLDVVAPAGLTLWFEPELIGPIAITYEAQAVSAGGPFDRVSDLNAFWTPDC